MGSAWRRSGRGTAHSKPAASGTHGAAVVTGPIRLPVEVPRAVPEPSRRLLRQRLEPNRGGGAARPDRPDSVDLRPFDSGQTGQNRNARDRHSGSSPRVDEAR